jgi:hypothetical protein
MMIASGTLSYNTSLSSVIIRSSSGRYRRTIGESLTSVCGTVLAFMHRATKPAGISGVSAGEPDALRPATTPSVKLIPLVDQGCSSVVVVL